MPPFPVGRISDDGIEGVLREKSVQVSRVPIERNDPLRKTVRVDIAAEKVVGNRLDLVGDEARGREFFREQKRDDARSGARLQHVVPALEAAEVSEEDAVLGEAEAFPGLRDLHHARVAE